MAVDRLPNQVRYSLRAEKLQSEWTSSRSLSTAPAAVYLFLESSSPHSLAICTHPPTMAEGDGEVAVVVPFKKRGAKGKAGLRKRPVTPPPVGDDSDGDSDSDGYDGDYGTSGDEAGLRVKRRKKNTGGVTASSRGLQAAAALVDISSRETVFSADRSVPISISNDATKQSNWYDEGATVAPASKAKTAAGGDEVDGTYLGLAHRPSFIQKNPNVPNRSIGPVKAPTNVRTITVIDFAPDVCKE